MGFKINFPESFKQDAELSAKRAAARPVMQEHMPHTPNPTDKPHYTLVGGEFFNAIGAKL